MSGQVDEIFRTVADTAEEIRGALASRRSYREAENPSGETQLAADIYADELLEDSLLELPAVASYASEEQETPTSAPDAGQYHLTCDPLDGSSNLQSNNGMGTIVGVYNRPLPAPGDALVGACYVLYGPITTMVTDHEGTVREYLVEDDSRSLLTDDVTLPTDPVVYGFGGRRPDWTPAFTEYAQEVELDRLKLRYGGAMIADINQVLSYGGIFGYPMLEDSPNGKLRLQFEGHPVAKILTDAGGASSDGTQSLLDRKPESLHARSPVFVGNESLIEELEATLDS